MDVGARFVFIGVVSLLAVGRQSEAEEWTVFLRRVGPLAIGTSISEARRIIGDPSAALVEGPTQKSRLPRDPDDSPCAYLTTAKVPSQLGLMFQHGRLARVDVWKTGVRTASGAQVGDTEARILELYGARVTVTPHRYPPVGAHYMIFTPLDAADGEYQMLFETDGVKVTRFRVGAKAAVGQVEGCS